MLKLLASNDKDGLALQIPSAGYGTACDVREVAWGDLELFQRKIQALAGSTAQWVNCLPYWHKELSSVPSSHRKCQVQWHVLEILGRQSQEDP